MIHEDNAPIVIVERGTRRAVRAPVRVFDGGRMVVIVIVMLRQVNMGGRQRRRDDSRGDEQ